MIASCGHRVKSYRAKEADGKWFCPGCYSEYVNTVRLVKSTDKIGGVYNTWVRYKNDGKIHSFVTVGMTKETAEARALSQLPEQLKEKFNEIL